MATAPVFVALSLLTLLVLLGRPSPAFSARPPSSTVQEASKSPSPSPPDDGDDADSSPSSSSSSSSFESLLLSFPEPSSLRTYLHDLTLIDHVAGTPGDYADARYVLEKFKSFGLAAEMEEIPATLSYPRTKPRLAAPDVGYEAKLSEDVLDFDPTSGLSTWRNHTFSAYSPGGTVRAPIVYANYGRPEDFDALENVGVNVSGKIVLVRYGECFRGLKAMNAESRGAVGTVLYSDPQQDGFTRGSTYPRGPWRPESGVQRGSALFISRCAGDPYRPYLNGTGRTVEDVCGYSSEDIVPSRPVLPISYGDAGPLLGRIGGPAPPPGFEGGLPDVPYSVGPSEFEVTLEVDMELESGAAIPNVYATIPGSDPRAGSVVMGNHRDAWAFGAADPNSGTSALLEAGRAFAALLSAGWRPLRTIVLASWSGEEYGFLGSTAFAEMREDGPLLAGCVAYLNVDVAVSGPGGALSAAATHSLDRLFYEAAAVVPAPPPDDDDEHDHDDGNGGGEPEPPSRARLRESGSEDPPTLADRWVAVTPTNAGDGRASPPSSLVPTHKMGTLGSGSDYTAFLDRYGIPSLDMMYEVNYGVYHSIYDSFAWMDAYGDPTYEKHRAMTRLWSLLSYRLSSDEVLPFHMTTQAEYITGYVEDMADEAGRVGVDLTPLREAAKEFREAAVRVDEESERARARARDGGGGEGGDGPPSSVRGARDGIGAAGAAGGEGASASASASAHDLNRRLSGTERRFLVDSGLPRRPWFRHVLQAPGYYLGYGSRSFPGAAEALDDGDVDLAREEVGRAAEAVRAAAKFLAGGGEGEGERGGGGGGGDGAAGGVWREERGFVGDGDEGDASFIGV